MKTHNVGPRVPPVPGKGESPSARTGETRGPTLLRVLPCALILFVGFTALAQKQANSSAATKNVEIKRALAKPPATPQSYVRTFNFDSLRRAILDLKESGNYPDGDSFLQRLAELQESAAHLPDDPIRAARLAAALKTLKRDALLANPLLDFDRLLLVKHDAQTLAFPRNDACYSSLSRLGYDCEIDVLSPVTPEGKLSTVFKPSQSNYLSDIDLHFDADKMLFTMSDAEHWNVYEARVDGTGLQRLTSSPHNDVDFFDACYLPNGNIIFASTANFQSVPCYNGTRKLGGLYLMDQQKRVRQLTFDQDDNSYPTVMNNGRVMFTRWEYSGIPHFFTRRLFQMNPDGSGQEELYGSNSYWPNAIYQARPIPRHASQFVGIVSGHHGDRRIGELVIFDPAKGTHETNGVVQRIPGFGKKIEPKIKDTLVNDSWPKFMNPWPLNEKYFLVSCKPNRQANWGIYLADVFDNLLLIRELDHFALLEPIPLKPRPLPPSIPEKVQAGNKDALVYLVDVYKGAGLKDVPRGTIKSLRIIQPHFGYFGNAGWLNIGIDGPWDVQRILGTVSVGADGSAYFKVPANTPISVQPLDAEGKAVQRMRSWFTAMPGERKSCVGCHEGHSSVTPNSHTLALDQPAQSIRPWHGPARGFDFERDVQPVLDAHCTRCHDASLHDNKASPDLRAKKVFPDYKGVIAPIPQIISNGVVATNVSPDDMGLERSDLSERHHQYIQFTPAYEALHPYVRRGGLESDAYLLTPTEFSADTSELFQLLKKGHHGVRLDSESWDRLITWIDLDVPCHGTWHEVYPVPFQGVERRREYLRLYGNIDEDYEAIPNLPRPNFAIATNTAEKNTTANANPASPPSPPSHGGEGRGEEAKSNSKTPLLSPLPTRSSRGEEEKLSTSTAEKIQPDGSYSTTKTRGSGVERHINLGNGVVLDLVLVPAGEFLMGNTNGSEGEPPPTAVTIERPFWLGKFEINNREYAQFDPSHDSGYISQLETAVESRGYPVNQPDQPVVRISWNEAMRFCEWLAQRTGEKFSLPTEAQWEYACRAGTQTELSFGSRDTDFSAWANMADRSLEQLARRVPGKMLYSDNPDWALRDNRSYDGALVTTNVGSYRPNAWGLYDMHGNAAEWTSSSYTGEKSGVQSRAGGPPAQGGGANSPSPGQAGRLSYIDAGDLTDINDRKVVRGGSWYDRPYRCASSFRWGYPAWRKVYNVGFRVMCETEPVKRAAR